MTIPAEILEAEKSAVDRERRRCVGVVLAEYATWKLSGEERIAAVLDALATKLEHGEEG